MQEPSLPRRHAPRHCMVVDNHWPDIRVEREARALLARGYEVEVICTAGAGRQAGTTREDGLTVHRLPVMRRGGESRRAQLVEYVTFFLRATLRLTRLHARRPFDTVQAHNVPDFLVFAAVVPKLTGAGIILDLHDLMPEFFASRFGKSMSSPIVRALKLQERLAIAFADRAITVSTLWRRTLIERGAAAGRVTVIMNLPDPGPFGQPLEDRAEHDGVIRILYHGTLTYRYGVDLLLRAVADIRNDFDVHLTVHGYGELLDELRRLAAELSLEDRISFSTRRLPTSELRGLIEAADIGVVPYRNDAFTDGILPTKLMEYAYFGVPTVASRSSAIAHYFTSDMVEFCEPGDLESLRRALVRLAGDRERRAALARRVRRFATTHRWEEEAARYSALVESLQPARRRPANQESRRGRS